MITAINGIDMTADLFAKYDRRRQPVLIKQGICHWRAVNAWTTDYLIDKMSSKTVAVHCSTTGVFNSDPNSKSGTRVIPVAASAAIKKIFNPIQTSEKFYLSQQSMSHLFPELMGDIQVPPYIPSGKLQNTNIWIGSAGNASPLHFDTSDNFFAQVVGRKTIQLYPPGRLRSFYPFTGRQTHHVSRVNPDKIDQAVFPRFASHKAISLLIEPGDLLFLPSRWWHFVRSIDHSISVNFWWQQPFRAVLGLWFRQAQLMMDKAKDQGT